MTSAYFSEIASDYASDNSASYFNIGSVTCDVTTTNSFTKQIVAYLDSQSTTATASEVQWRIKSDYDKDVFKNAYTKFLKKRSDKWCWDGWSWDSNDCCTAATINTTTIGDTCWTWHYAPPMPATPKEKLRELLKSRQAPAVHVRQGNAFGSVARGRMGQVTDIREVRARETLSRIIGENRFRKFLKDGFISVRATSGKVYQIYPGHGITCVWKDGEMVERLCVYLRGNYPPTDELIMRYVMILSNEQDFRNRANVHKAYARGLKIAEVDERPLTEIYQEFKKAA